MFSGKSIFLFVLCSMVLILAACSLPLGPTPEPVIVTLLEPDTVVPTLRPDAERDACLDGNWNMDAGFLDLLLANLVPLPNIGVPEGSLGMYFSDGSFIYDGHFIVRVNLGPDQYIQADSVFSTRGLYATEGGSTLVLDITASEIQPLEWKAYSNGREESYPGGGPSVVINPPGSAPYRCTQTDLEIDTLSPAGDTVTMFFVR
jgi:hypothetical protein